MKNRAASLLACVLTLASCEKPKDEVTVTETRPLSTRDGSPKLNATSDERFRDAKPSPVEGDTPDGWLKLPASQFRLLNYKFGESGMGEVWVSLSQGSVLDNANRWLKQFSEPPMDEAALAKLPTVTIAGATGRWVTAEGDYAGGMGAPPRNGFAMAGVIAQVGGQILTVKMVGPKAEVQATKPVLEKFSSSLRMAGMMAQGAGTGMVPPTTPGADSSPVKGDTPDGWETQPATPFRLLNYKFGESGTGEVWVSLSQGSVIDNANRWLNQFSQPPMDDAALAKLPTVMIAGATGRWVTAEGDYAGGMGAPPRDGFALAGVIAQVGGQILTVKMIGPKAEVQAAKPVLEKFAGSLRMTE